MITVIPLAELGGADHGWLVAKHHFSFNQYYNPKRVHFGALHVINDDLIKAGQGFAPHPHQDMEIITYVREGAITHKDNQGNEGRTEAGDVQVMSAGTGIVHSEYNLEAEDTRLYQIWIEPNVLSMKPRWDAHRFPKEPVTDQLNLLVAADESAPLQIHQDATIHAGRLLAGTTITHPIRHQAYVLVSSGAVTADGQLLSAGDGGEITDQAEVTFLAQSDAELLVIDVPPR